MTNSDLFKLITVNQKFIQIYEQAIKNIGIYEVDAFLEQFCQHDKNHLNQLIDHYEKQNGKIDQSNIIDNLNELS